jgi:predicted RNA methylase
MGCCCSSFRDSAERMFTPKKAAAEIARYRQNGPGPTTRLLRDGLVNAGLVGRTVLDIGGGVGALSFELLDRGVHRAVIVDASPAYLEAASNEAARRGRSAAMSIVPGDFVAVSEQIPSRSSGHARSCRLLLSAISAIARGRSAARSDSHRLLVS